MGYTNIEFKDGMVLKEDHLNHLQDGVHKSVGNLEDFELFVDGTIIEKEGQHTDISNMFDFDYTTGTIYDGSSSKNSVFMTTTTVDISNYVGYKIKMTIPVFTTSQGIRPTFYNAILDENNVVLSKVQLDKHPDFSTLKGDYSEYEFIVPERAKYLIAHNFNNKATQDASLSGSYTQGLIVFEGDLDDFSCVAIEIIKEEIGSASEYMLNNPGIGYSLTEFDKDEICDYYAVTNDGEYELASGYGCSSFIPCKGSKEMLITMMQEPDNKYGLAFYDENKVFLSFIPSIVGDKSYVIKKVVIPSNAYYFKTSYFDYETSKNYGEFKAYMFTDNNVYSNGKRPYQTEYIWFSQAVNQSITKFWETDANTVKIDSNFKSTTGVLTLPETYKPSGKKTPLILYCHGFSHYVYYGAWGANDTFLPQKKHWTDMGFAVMDVNGARNNDRKGNFQTGFCPQGMAALKQCVDYVIEHYNVDEQIYIVCGSAGGTSGWNYARVYPKDVRAMVAIATWSKLSKNCYNSNKSLYTEYLGFGNSYDKSKTVGLDPYDSLVTIGDTTYAFSPSIPVLYLYGSADSGDFCQDTLNYVNYLRNAGLPAQTRMYQGLGHEIVSGANEVVDKEIGNWLLMH